MGNGSENVIGATRGQGSYQLPVRLGRLAPAEVAQGPGGVTEHADLVVFAEEGQQGTEGTLLEDVVPALGTVTGDVAQSPDSLFPDIEDWRREQLDELGNGLGADNDLSVLSGARGNVGKRPRGFELWHKTSQSPTIKVARGIGSVPEAWSGQSEGTRRNGARHHTR